MTFERFPDEIERNPEVERRLENTALLVLASERIEVDDSVAARAASLQIAGYGPYDALHLACAEAAQVDVLLTTDDVFIRKASRRDGNPLVAVLNPLFWNKRNTSWAVLRRWPMSNLSDTLWKSSAVN
jgi:hypothetical protein